MTESPMLRSALAYSADGWPVLPVGAGSKEPLIKEWPTRATCDPALIRKWWKRWPDANVGILTGIRSGLVAIDIDPRRGGMAERLFKEFPTRLRVRTGSGGIHLYYAHPGGYVQNRVTEAGIDVRGDGGFVVAPPSLHESGGRYEWIQQGEPGGRLPALLLERRQSVGPAGAGWIVRALAGVDEGTRNETASRLARYFARKGIPPDIVVGILQAWNARNRPPLPDE